MCFYYTKNTLKNEIKNPPVMVGLKQLFFNSDLAG